MASSIVSTGSDSVSALHRLNTFRVKNTTSKIGAAQIPNLTIASGNDSATVLSSVRTAEATSLAFSIRAVAGTMLALTLKIGTIETQVHRRKGVIQGRHTVRPSLTTKPNQTSNAGGNWVAVLSGTVPQLVCQELVFDQHLKAIRDHNPKASDVMAISEARQHAESLSPAELSDLFVKTILQDAERGSADAYDKQQDSIASSLADVEMRARAQRDASGMVICCRVARMVAMIHLHNSRLGCSVLQAYCRRAAMNQIRSNDFYPVMKENAHLLSSFCKAALKRKQFIIAITGMHKAIWQALSRVSRAKLRSRDSQITKDRSAIVLQKSIRRIYPMIEYQLHRMAAVTIEAPLRRLPLLKPVNAFKLASVAANTIQRCLRRAIVQHAALNEHKFIDDIVMLLVNRAILKSTKANSSGLRIKECCRLYWPDICPNCRLKRRREQNKASSGEGLSSININGDSDNEMPVDLRALTREQLGIEASLSRVRTALQEAVSIAEAESRARIWKERMAALRNEAASSALETKRWERDLESARLDEWELSMRFFSNNGQISNLEPAKTSSSQTPHSTNCTYARQGSNSGAHGQITHSPLARVLDSELERKSRANTSLRHSIPYSSGCDRDSDRYIRYTPKPSPPPIEQIHSGSALRDPPGSRFGGWQSPWQRKRNAKISNSFNSPSPTGLASPSTNQATVSKPSNGFILDLDLAIANRMVEEDDGDEHSAHAGLKNSPSRSTVKPRPRPQTARPDLVQGMKGSSTTGAFQSKEGQGRGRPQTARQFVQRNAEYGMHNISSRPTTAKTWKSKSSGFSHSSPRPPQFGMAKQSSRQVDAKISNSPYSVGKSRSRGTAAPLTPRPSPNSARRLSQADSQKKAAIHNALRELRTRSEESSAGLIQGSRDFDPQSVLAAAVKIQQVDSGLARQMRLLASSKSPHLGSQNHIGRNSANVCDGAHVCEAHHAHMSGAFRMSSIGPLAKVASGQQPSNVDDGHFTAHPRSKAFSAALVGEGVIELSNPDIAQLITANLQHNHGQQASSSDGGDGQPSLALSNNPVSPKLPKGFPSEDIGFYAANDDHSTALLAQPLALASQRVMQKAIIDSRDVRHMVYKSSRFDSKRVKSKLSTESKNSGSLLQKSGERKPTVASLSDISASQELKLRGIAQNDFKNHEDQTVLEQLHPKMVHDDDDGVSLSSRDDMSSASDIQNADSFAEGGLLSPNSARDIDITGTISGTTSNRNGFSRQRQQKAKRTQGPLGFSENLAMHHLSKEYSKQQHSISTNKKGRNISSKSEAVVSALSAASLAENSLKSYADRAVAADLRVGERHIFGGVPRDVLGGTSVHGSMASKFIGEDVLAPSMLEAAARQQQPAVGGGNEVESGKSATPIPTDIQVAAEQINSGSDVQDGPENDDSGISSAPLARMPSSLLAGLPEDLRSALQRMKLGERSSDN